MVQKSKYLFAILLLLVCGTNIASVAAAGMTVSPTYVRLSVASDKVVDSASVTVKNSSAQAAQYKADITDVSSDTGVLSPLDIASITTKNTFGLSQTEFTLESGQSINIIVKATNTGSLAPGGHYAALTLRQIFTAKGKQQPLSQVVSVGIFLVKEEGSVRQISLRTNPLKKILFTTIKEEEISITNSGNVEVVPRAVINITRGAQTYQKALINESSSHIFPAKDKYYDAKYTKLKSMPIGRYTKTIAYRYDGQKDQTVVSEYFWYVPISFVINCLVIAAFMLAVFALKRRKRTIAKPLVMPKQDATARSASSQEPRATTIETMTKNAVKISQPRSMRKKIQDVGAKIEKPKKKKKTSKSKPKTKEKKLPNKSE